MENKSFIPVCEPLLAGNEIEYVNDALKTGWISSAGKYVTAFEEKFAEYCGVKHAISVCNGTVALHLALTALGIKEGDEVIIPNFTMIASAFAVCYTGAKPVFVDADPDTWNIDCNKIEEKITPRTKVIMPVHIFGNPCDMDRINQLAKKHGIMVLEDSAEAHGAIYKGKKAGNLSDIAAFSFFANKNITTGEGGMVVTNCDDLADKARYFKNVCFPKGSRNYLHQDIGFNYRMSNLHAAIGLAQVEKADEYKKLRIRNGKYYRERFGAIKGLKLQIDQSNSENVHWMNGLCLTEEYPLKRDQLIENLRSKGIDTRLFFNGMNRQKSLINYGCEANGDFTVSDDLANNGFYLPSGSNLPTTTIDYICDTIKNFGSK